MKPHFALHIPFKHTTHLSSLFPHPSHHHTRIASLHPQDTDHKRLEFQRYLEKAGVLETISRVLAALYELPEKPLDAAEFVHDFLSVSSPEDVELLKQKFNMLQSSLNLVDENIVRAQKENNYLLMKIDQLLRERMLRIIEAERLAQQRLENPHLAEEEEQGEGENQEAEQQQEQQEGDDTTSKSATETSPEQQQQQQQPTDTTDKPEQQPTESPKEQPQQPQQSQEEKQQQQPQQQTNATVHLKFGGIEHQTTDLDTIDDGI